MGLLATDATTGFLNIPTCDGPPTGKPACLAPGDSPAVYDQINGVLYVYNQPLQKWLGADMPYPMAAARGHINVSNAAFNPGAYGTLANWYKAGSGKYSDAGTTPTTDGQGVRQWNDFQGTANLSQATAGNRPTDKTTYLDFVSASSQQLKSANGANAGALGGQDGTIVCDFWLNSGGVFSIASRDAFAGGWNLIYHHGVAGVAINTWNGSGYQTTNGVTLTTSSAAWHQVVVRYTHAATKIELFLDGVSQVSNSSRTIAAPNGGNALEIGTSVGGYNPLDGRIGQFACYPSTAISDAAIAAWYANRTT